MKAHPFVLASLWQNLADNARLSRVVYVDVKNGLLYALTVDGKFPRDTYRFPDHIPLTPAIERVTSGYCILQDECLRLPEMMCSEDELSHQQKAERKERLEAIRGLLEESRLRALLDPKTREAIIQAHVDLVGKPRNNILRVLTRYWWFGCDENALLHARSLRGAPGVVRIGTKNKVGRKSALEQIRLRDEHLPAAERYAFRQGLPNFRGRSTAERDIPKFERALVKYWVENNISLRNTYDLMVANDYLQLTRLQGDTVVRGYPVDPSKLPTFNQFKYRAREIIERLGLQRKKVGEFDFERGERAMTGSSADIAYWPGRLTDMDVMVAKLELTSDDKFSRHIGQSRVALAVDRGSQAIVGFEEYIGDGESAANYKMALFWSIVGPKEHVKHLDLDDEDIGLAYSSLSTYGTPVAIYVDRGPARGEIVHKDVVGGLSIDRETAPPEWPLGKVVESMIGRIQRILAELPGGYSRRKGRRNQERAEKARENARISRSAFRKILMAAIVEHNRYLDARKLLTREMIDEGVKPNPEAIYAWGQSKYGARPRRQYSRAEAFHLVLTSETRNASKSGVRLKSMLFTSDSYVRWFESTIKKKNRKVVIASTGASPNVVIWLRDGNEIDYLYATKATARAIDGFTFEEVEREQLNQRAEVQAQGIRKAKAGLLSSTTTKALDESTGRKLPKVPTKRAVQQARIAERGNDRKSASDLVDRVFPEGMKPSAPLPATPLSRSESIDQSEMSFASKADEVAWRVFHEKFGSSNGNRKK